MSKSNFAAWRLPGGEWNLSEGLIADNGHLSGDGITIAPWVNSSKAFDGQIQSLSTARTDYETSVNAIVSRLAAAGSGKTVISRCICGTVMNSDTIFSRLDSYFERFCDMFCFIFHHPSTGWWTGASPELVAAADINGTTLTRALAGTRTAGADAPWDNKNRKEHMMVVDSICADISGCCPGAGIAPGSTGTLKYGAIEHMCTPISISGASAGAISRAIHPTAAIAGLPRSQALDDISAYECHDRRFYAGLISTSTVAYAVLRCVNFDDRNWCVYTGSGITGLSSPADEWAETEAKARPLTDLFTFN